jgi:hypothetical protein
MDRKLRPRQPIKYPRHFSELFYCPIDENAAVQMCLKCPLPDCIHDKRQAERKQRLQSRAREMHRMHQHERKNIREIAELYKVSERTVLRALEMINKPRMKVPAEDDETD